MFLTLMKPTNVWLSHNSCLLNQFSSPPVCHFSFT